jgi:alpha-1,6-mannosyltransferase
VAIAADRLRPVGERVSRVPSEILERLYEWDQSIRRLRPVNAIVRSVQAPVTNDIGSPRCLIKPAILGFVASLLVAFGASQPGSPFVLQWPNAWFFGVSSAGQTTGTIFFGLVCVYGGIILFVRVWLGILKALAQAPGTGLGKLWWLFSIWALPVVIAPPLFSHDIYSYAAQGEMVSHHISPYLYGPSTLGPGNAFTQLVDRWWINTPSPYGPFFLRIAGTFTSISGHDVLIDLVLLRLLAVGGVVLIGVGLASLARSIGRSAGLAFGLAVLNPVTIFHLIGGAHNDALMVGLLVCGLALAKRNHPVLGIVLCALAASVKAPAAIGIVYICWEWVGEGAPVRERVRPVVTGLLIGGTVMGALSLVTGLGWGWVGDLSSADAVRSWLSPATGSGLLITDVLHVFGSSVGLSSVLSVTRALGLIAAGIWCVWILLNSERIGAVKALGYSLLLVVVLSPVVQPWYLSWGIVLLAPVLTAGWTRRVVIALSISAVVIGLPGGQTLLHDLLSSDPLEVAGALLLLLGVLLSPLGMPVRRSVDRLAHERRPLVAAAAQVQPHTAGGALTRSPAPAPQSVQPEHGHPRPAFPSRGLGVAHRGRRPTALEGPERTES